MEVQRRATENSTRHVGMGKRKSPPTIAPDVGIGDEGTASEDEVVVVASPTVTSPTGFPPRPTRPQGSKAAKADLLQQKKREKILQSQARATETMAEASLRKANALQDQCAMSLFTMPLEQGMTEDARRYFTLRRQEEIHRLERRMRVERRVAELEEIEHAKLLRLNTPINLVVEPTTAKNGHVAATMLPVDSHEPPATGAGETPRGLVVLIGTTLTRLYLIVGFMVSCCLLGLRV